MKICSQCRCTKPFTEFYTHPQARDGRFGKCKPCYKTKVAKYRAENIDYVRAYDRLRAKRPENVVSAIEINKRWRQADKRRSSCHNKVARAVKRGTLVPQPCERCGAKAGAHHESYDEPLTVMWLCQAHHMERHKELAILGIMP